MSGIRCFIALEIPADVQRTLNGVIRDLQAAGADVKWVEPGNIHLTLKFLGELDTKKVEDVRSLIRSFRGCLLPIPSGLGALGAFPNLNKPQVVWTGISHGQQEISKLFNRLDEGLQNFGFPKKQRKFSPHLTLGRVRSGRNLHGLSDLLKSYGQVKKDFTVSELDFFKSTLTPQGAVYQVLEKVILSR